jgi:hypothetical protein
LHFTFDLIFHDHFLSGSIPKLLAFDWCLCFLLVKRYVFWIRDDPFNLSCTNVFCDIEEMCITCIIHSSVYSHQHTHDLIYDRFKNHNGENECWYLYIMLMAPIKLTSGRVRTSQKPGRLMTSLKSSWRWLATQTGRR